MDNFLEQLAEIFEVDNVNLSDVLIDFEAWDSLSQLSIISLADEEFGVQLTASDLLTAETIGGLAELIKDKSNL
jgi:acyl carrier protein